MVGEPTVEYAPPSAIGPSGGVLFATGDIEVNAEAQIGCPKTSSGQQVCTTTYQLGWAQGYSVSLDRFDTISYPNDRACYELYDQQEQWNNIADFASAVPPKPNDEWPWYNPTPGLVMLGCELKKYHAHLYPYRDGPGAYMAVTLTEQPKHVWLSIDMQLVAMAECQEAEGRHQILGEAPVEYFGSFRSTTYEDDDLSTWVEAYNNYYPHQLDLLFGRLGYSDIGIPRMYLPGDPEPCCNLQFGNENKSALQHVGDLPPQECDY